jgi:serine/threonine protein kinase
MLSLEGQQLGNYDVIRRIRVGGMGAVYEGRQRTAFDRRVAIKVILGDYAADKDMRRRFAREARAIARLHHPHILPLIEFGDERGILYLVMPFIDGGTLTSYLRRTLPGLAEVADIYQQLLDAVEHAHEEGFIHRDIKSSNILLEQTRSGADGASPRPPHVYLADFGLARPVYQHDPTQVGKPIPLDQVPGTPHYMAPEQTFGIVTPLTDIYALGVLLYQLLTGELPYNDLDDVRVIQMHLQDPIPSPCERDASIPVELDAVVRKAMAKKPEERYQSVAELRAAFLEAVKGSEETSGIPVVTDEAQAGSAVHDDGGIVEVPMPVKRHPPTPLKLHEPSPGAVRLARQSSKYTLPFLMPHRSRKDRLSISSVAIHSQHGKLGNTGSIERSRIAEFITHKRRTTGDTNEKDLKRGRQWYLSTLIICVLFGALLLTPRALGLVGIRLPVNIPYLSPSPPTATVYITPQIQNVEDTFVLTASDQVGKPDFITHTIPDHKWQASASDSISVQASGTKLVGGTQAHGTLVFNNASNQEVMLPASFMLTTPAGVQLQLTQSLTIPAHRKGEDGQANVMALVSAMGVAGNLAAHSVDGLCCGVGITVSNPASFSGGEDGQAVHVLAQADLDSARNALVPRLEQRIVQQIKQRITPDDQLAGDPIYSIVINANSPLGSPVDRAQVSVNIAGVAISYSGSLASQIAVQLLSKQAIQSLDSNYYAQGNATIVGKPAIQAGQNGTIYISLQVRGTWIYQHSSKQIGQWIDALRGATTAAAEAYLKAQPGIANIQISLPFGADRLPNSYNQIDVVLVKPGG